MEANAGYGHGPGAGNPTILVVEDNPRNMKLMRIMLRAKG